MVLNKKSVEVGKVLTIKLVDKNVPSYTFDGEWTGRDIMVVGRTIARAYRKEQLGKRRLLQPEVSEKIEVPMEASK